MCGTSEQNNTHYIINRNEIQKFLEDTPFPICLSKLMTLVENGEYATYVYYIYGNDLRPKTKHTLIFYQNRRVFSSEAVPFP
jgi:hypothetical protein